MENDLRIISGGAGSFVLNDTSEFTGNFDAIVVLEDTIISSIKIEDVDVTSEYIANASTAVKLGAIIRPKNPNSFEVPNKFSSVQLSSGSVVIVL
jgi:hypothetical protein